MNNFFIMINHPNGEIVPMMRTDDDIAMFNSVEEAHAMAGGHGMCQSYGYEIFKRGSGEQ